MDIETATVQLHGPLSVNLLLFLSLSVSVSVSLSLSLSLCPALPLPPSLPLSPSLSHSLSLSLSLSLSVNLHPRPFLTRQSKILIIPFYFPRSFSSRCPFTVSFLPF